MAKLVYRIYSIVKKDLIHEGNRINDFQNYSDPAVVLEPVYGNSNDYSTMYEALIQVDNIILQHKEWRREPLEFTILPIIT